MKNCEATGFVFFNTDVTGNQTGFKLKSTKHNRLRSSNSWIVTIVPILDNVKIKEPNDALWSWKP